MADENEQESNREQEAAGKSAEEQELAELYKQMEQEVAQQQKVTAQPVELPPLEKPAQAPQVDQKNKDVNLSMILDIPVDVHVELGQTQLSIQDILRLGPGSIMELDRLAGGSADIVVNGKLVGQGDVVVINENFGIRITKLVDPQKRVEIL